MYDVLIPTQISYAWMNKVHLLTYLLRQERYQDIDNVRNMKVRQERYQDIDNVRQSNGQLYHSQ